jgi:PAS domain S-box-containing protein
MALQALDGRYLRVNRALCDMLGYAPEELLATTYAAVVYPDELPTHRDYDRRMVSGEIGSYQCERRYRHRRGHAVWALVSISLIRSRDGQPTYFLVQAQDVTGRKQAEEARHATEARYRGLIEGSIQGICVHTDMVLQFANVATARIFGYESPEELIGVDFRRLIAPHELPRVDEYFGARLARELVTARYEVQGVRRDGTLVWVELLATPAPWWGPGAILVTFVDVSERKQFERQFLQAQKMEALGRLAGGVAHDFNNLLAVIIGRAEMLLHRLPENDPARRPVELIRTAGDKAAALTRQLLAFSRKQALESTVLDLSDVVANAERLHRRLVGEDIRVVTLRSPTPCAVKTDPGQLEQVILNLVVNARDAMPHGGQLTLETRAVELDAAFARAHPGARAGPHALLVVSDTGAGMTAEVRQHIFEPFFTTKEPTKGTGLGLATVFGIVKQYGGYIAVESAPGQGATFRIYLPRVEAMTEAEAPAPAGPVVGGTETILLVEDDAAVRDLAREILTERGYAVVSARHPGEAFLIGARRSRTIELLLTDIVLPEMSGLELAERLTRLRSGLKVAYMTGYPQDLIVPQSAERAEVVVLLKPFTPAALAGAVRKALDAPSAGGGEPASSRTGGG